MQRPPLQRPSPSQGCAARANLALEAVPAMVPQAGCSRTRRRVSGESARTGPQAHRARPGRRVSGSRRGTRYPRFDGVSRRFSPDSRAIFNYNLKL